MGAIEQNLDNPDVAAALVKNLEAEARKYDAEAETARHEARFKSDEADNSHVELQRNLEARERELVSNFHLRIYPFSFSVNETTVNDCMRQLNVWHRLNPGEPVEIIFSSPGGSVVDGIKLYDHIKYLRASGTPINTTALGMAASMAGILLQAGETRTIGAESWLMIHEVSFGAGGKIGEVEDTTEWVKAVQKRVLNIFAERSTLTVKQLDARWKRKDWWIDSAEAKSLGLVDVIR